MSDSSRRPRRNYLTARDTTTKFSHWRFLVFFLASGGKELFFLCFFAAFPVRESSGGSTHTPDPHTLSSKRDRSGAGQAKRLRELVLLLAENYLDLFFPPPPTRPRSPLSLPPIPLMPVAAAAGLFLMDDDSQVRGRGECAFLGSRKGGGKLEREKSIERTKREGGGAACAAACSLTNRSKQRTKEPPANPARDWPFRLKPTLPARRGFPSPRLSGFGCRERGNQRAPADEKKGR